MAKNPIIRIKYLAINRGAMALSFSLSLPNTRISPKINSSVPWPISPNITPNKKGKETWANIAGLISLYMGIP
jgi:hypothetical protein